MITADKPENEIERLETLHSYGILDSDNDPELNELTQLAADLCDTSIALIAFLDTDRVWFKSTVGAELPEVKRDLSFSSHVILQDEIFEVEDALKDERFWDNPLVTGSPNIRFFAGVPLVTPSGDSIGTLSVVSTKPNKLTSWQRKSLKVVSTAVISRLELKKKQEQLDALDHFQSIFVSNINHEIKTPLSGVMGLIDLLLGTPLNEKQKRYSKAIKRSGDALIRIIHDVLDLSKVKSGKLIIEQTRFDLDTVIDDLIDTYTPLAQEKNIELKSEIKPCEHGFKGDPYRIKQIMGNLISNAIKFTDQGRVVLRMKELSRENKHAQLRFSVIDTGVGLSLVQQEELFQRFQHVDDELARHSGGTGLGLSICKQLLELMQGDIGIRSELGKGSNFWFTLPLEITDKETSGEENQQRGSTIFDGRVLVAEDNRVNQIVAKGVLEKLGFTVEIAENGAVALTKLRDQFFDLVFLDCHMPVMSGFEAAKTIRSTNTLVHNPAIPIIAMSANVTNEEQKTCFDLGMNEFIAKPLSQESLPEILLKYLSPKNHLQNSDESTGDIFTSLEDCEVYNRSTVKTLRLNKNHLDIMRRTFLDTTPFEINRLSQGMIANDVQSVRSIAQSIKGTAGMLGADQIAALAEFIENNADLGDELPSRELISHLDQCLDRFQDQLTSSEGCS